MIRIENKTELTIKVPFLTPRGVKPKFFTIPPSKDGKPGVVELKELDSITINRLRHHYDRRPVDPKEPEGPHHEIGLMKVIVTDEGPEPDAAGGETDKGDADKGRGQNPKAKAA